MKKYRFILLLISFLPIVLYYTNVIKPYFKIETPDKINVNLVQTKNFRIHKIDLIYETWNENSSGRTTSGIYTKTIFFDANKRQLYMDTNFLPESYLKLYCNSYFELNENKELQLKDYSSNKTIYTSEQLKLFIKNTHQEIYNYRIKDSIWTIKYKDGSEISFNENTIPEIKSCRSYTNREWSTKVSNGERSYLIFKNHLSKSDFLNLDIITDLDGKTPIINPSSKACLIQYQEQINGSYTTAWVDSLGNVLMKIKLNDFIGKNTNYYFSETNDELLIFSNDKINFISKNNGNLSYQLNLLGKAFAPNWVFWLVAIVWLMIFLLWWDHLAK